MRSTKNTPLLATALASFLIVGCGQEKEDSSQEPAPGESEVAVVVPDPKEQPPQPIVKEELPKEDDAGSAPKEEAPLAGKPGPGDVPEPTEASPGPKKQPAPPLTKVQPAPTPAPQGGVLTPQEVEELTQRAEDGSPKAQYDLGTMYADGGTGVEQDLAQAAVWFRKAAESGNPNAQYNLAMMLESGHGIEKDAEEAAKWFEEYNKTSSAE